MVKSMSAYGIPQDEIALALDISPHTLRKHFRNELNRGAIEANMQVLNALYKMAISGEVAGRHHLLGRRRAAGCASAPSRIPTSCRRSFPLS